MPTHKVAKPTSIVDLLKESALAPSKNQARQLIVGGGVRIDGVKVVDSALTVEIPPQNGSVLQVGRRQFVRLVA